MVDVSCDADRHERKISLITFRAVTYYVKSRRLGMSGFTSRSNACCRQLSQSRLLLGSSKATLIRGYAARRQILSPQGKTTADKDTSFSARPSAKRGPRNLPYHYLHDAKTVGKLLYDQAKCAAECVSALDPKFFSDVTVIEVNPGTPCGEKFVTHRSWNLHSCTLQSPET